MKLLSMFIKIKLKCLTVLVLCLFHMVPGFDFLFLTTITVYN